METSRDNVIYDLDAKYFYYAHGPLARVELGNDKVQGMDYAYTLQGWIKGVNSETLNETRDMGRDGDKSLIPNPNSLIARDAMGYSLGYFDGDYSAIDANKNLTANNFLADKTNSDLLNARKDLFNGNIGMMVTTIVPPTLSGSTVTYSPLPQGTAYKYDQLNRLKEMQAYQNLDAINNQWQSGGGYNFMYSNSFEYDANGNITKQKRFSAQGQAINDLTYQRLKGANGQLLQNRLYHVNDNVSPGDFTDDINDQGTFDNTANTVNTANNYGYDEIGNLIRNDQKEIALIKWTVAGKVRAVIRTAGSSKKNLLYDYDAMGNRIAKHVFSSGAVWEKTEYYIRDAQGNVLSIYTGQPDPVTQTMSFAQTEKHIYGSSRIGIEKTKTEMIGATMDTTNFLHTLGNKFYEGTNHLGNVLVIFTDRKFPIDSDNDNIVDYYLPDVTGANDYYPFGVKMKERSFNSANYRQQFNGKEFDSETETTDFGDRMQDGDLGVFLSIDPLVGRYPMQSPYVFAANNPISFIDVNGDSIIFVGVNSQFAEGLKTLLKTPSGKELLLKYWNSKTEDIYITVSNKPLKDAYAATYPPDATSSIIKNNKVDITSRDRKLSTEGMEKFQGLDISKSKGRKVSFVMFDPDAIKEGDKFKTAFALFHEIQAHIEDAQVDMKLGEDRYKLEHTLFGPTSFEKPGPFTAAYDITQELNALKSAEEVAAKRKQEHEKAGGRIPEFNYDETAPKFPPPTQVKITFESKPTPK